MFKLYTMSYNKQLALRTSEIHNNHTYEQKEDLRMNILMVALGGALGAVGRYLISLVGNILPYKLAFPLLTFITNVVGAFLIGFIVGTMEENHVEEYWVACLKVGVCGGFTTFSTFSLENLNLIESGHSLTATIYMVLSVLLCIAGVWLGRTAAHTMTGRL